MRLGWLSLSASLVWLFLAARLLSCGALAAAAAHNPPREEAKQPNTKQITLLRASLFIPKKFKLKFSFLFHSQYAWAAPKTNQFFFSSLFPFSKRREKRKEELICCAAKKSNSSRIQ